MNDPVAQARPSRAVADARQACAELGFSANTGVLDGLEVFWAEAGRGTPLLAVHGLNSCFFTWRSLLGSPPHGWQVLAPDLPGFGASQDTGPDTYTLGFARDFLATFIRSRELGKAVLVGHSFGALLCLELATALPELVMGVVLIGAPKPGGQPPEPKVRRHLLLFSYEQPQQIDGLHFDVYRKLGVRTPTSPLFQGRFPNLSGPFPVDIPVLDLRGSNDRVIPPENALSFQRLIPCLHTASIPDAGHCCHEECPGPFLNAVRIFLDQLMEANAR